LSRTLVALCTAKIPDLRNAAIEAIIAGYEFFPPDTLTTVARDLSRDPQSLNVFVAALASGSRERLFPFIPQILAELETNPRVMSFTVRVAVSQLVLADAMTYLERWTRTG